MMCYKDKTFCQASMDNRCKMSDCYRFFSENDRINSRKWWNHDPDNAPIAVSDFSNDCSDYETDIRRARTKMKKEKIRA